MTISVGQASWRNDLPMFTNVPKIDGHHDVTNFEVDVIVWDIKTWPSQDWNMTFPWNNRNYLILL